MTKFDQFLKNFLKESPILPPAPVANKQTNIDVTKLTPEQLGQLVAAANNPNGTLDKNHPLYQNPQATQQATKPSTTSPAASGANNTIPNSQQQNAANKQTI